ncbi:MAG: hypothetical protein CMJ15_02850 [Pelagibacterium sp.]|nr:hypothetical protein [Pelagibacterium sp.]|tara:strand:+ start:4156 stop:6201 length:2046 start_codon:yes stop_codon:yes gene_type:complete
MSETFFGGSAATTGDGETARELASGPVEEQASPDAETSEAADAAGSQETATSVSEAVMPAFGLVRVEPDGSAVIAGSATPSGEVRIFANEDQIGAETAQTSGDFAFVTDAPLPTGGVELRILDVETDRFADTSVIVVVQDDRTSEPLVIASAPGEASEILQGLDNPTVAAAEQQAVPESPEPETSPETLAVAEADMESPQADPPAPNAAEPDVEMTADQDADGQTAADEALEAPGEAGNEQEESPASNIEANEAEPSQETAIAAPMTAPLQQTESVEEQSALAPQEQPAPVPATTPMQDEETTSPDETAPQDEGDVVEDAPAPVAVAAADEPAPPAQEPVPSTEGQEPVPADRPANVTPPLAESDDAETVVAAEEDAAVPAVEPDSAPSGEEPSDGAAAAVSEPAEDLESPAPAQPAVGAPPQQTFAAPTIDAVEIDGDRNFFAGAGEDGLSVRLYVDNAIVGSTEVSDGRWLIEAIDVLDQENQRIRIDMLAEDGSVVGRAEVDFILELPEAVDEDIVVAEQRETETVGASPAQSQEADLSARGDVETPDAPEPVTSDAAEPPAPTAEPAQSAEPAETVEPTGSGELAEPAETVEPAIPTLVGVSDGNRTATGLAIIRQGDNLWTIARRVYGEGIRYTQIFEANTDQIRNPDLIYPGQVFDLPGTDEVIGEADDAASSRQ